MLCSRINPVLAAGSKTGVEHTKGQGSVALFGNPMQRMQQIVVCNGQNHQLCVQAHFKRAVSFNKSF